MAGKLLKTLLALGCGAALCSCAHWQAVTVYPGMNAQTEIIIQPSLQKLVAERRPNLKIALRVQEGPKYVTQETIKELDKQYDFLERELARAGFIVRDRMLLEKVFACGKNTTYREVAQTIDTDLIIEILYLGPCDLTHNKYYDPKTGQVKELHNPSLEQKKPGSMSFIMGGGQLDCRVISVNDGTVAGMITVYNLPCAGECPFEILPDKAWRNPGAESKTSQGWSVGTPEQNARELARLLVQVLKEGDLVVSQVNAGSVAEAARLQAGDLLLKLNGNAIDYVPQMIEALTMAGGKNELLIRRNDQDMRAPFTKNIGEPMGLQVTYRPKPAIQPATPPPPAVAVAPPAPAPVVMAPPPPAPAVKKPAGKKKRTIRY